MTNSARQSGTKAGMALLLTLGFTALLTILVIAYFSVMRLDRLSTQNYSQSVRAQELSLGALEEILEDLRSEVDAGSLQDAAYVQNGRRVYMPMSPASALPARTGFDEDAWGADADGSMLPPSLIRVSRAEDDFYNNPPDAYDPALLPPNRASSVSSSSPSANGRRMTAARWNKPLLLGMGVPSVFQDNPPDWIYVTRSGSRVYTNMDVAKLKSTSDLSQGESLLGRYSYVIYEQGGLLDVNVAGYLSMLASSPGGPESIRGKSVTVYADLGVLPGMGGKTPELDGLVNWRSKGGITFWGSFLNMVRENGKRGFLRFRPGDSPLLGRQDLIDYFQKKIGTTEPLSYLTHFSRSLNAPSWSPRTPPGSTIDYAAGAGNPASANRNLVNVRFQNAGTVVHYDDAAQSLNYSVEEGDSLLQSRFSLARLAWLEEADPDTGTGPASAKEEAIKDCFGLVWDYPGGAGGATRTANGGNKCWNYVGATGTLANFSGRIKTLDEIAGEGREPDFFELLKAAILSGSLGKGPGPAMFVNGTKPYVGNGSYWYRSIQSDQMPGVAGMYSHTLGPYSSVPAPARIPDMQIIRIGANIIDQYDEDSYPTAIYFRYDGVGNSDPARSASGLPIFGPVTMAYGTENLPYLSKIDLITTSPVRSSSEDPGPDTDVETRTFGAWRQPELWNPHQESPVPLVKRPSHFQIRAYGSAMMGWDWHLSITSAKFLEHGYKKGISHVVDYYLTNDNTEVSDVGTINFTDSTATSAFYDKPYPLLADGIPGVTASSPYLDGYRENRGNSGMAHYDEAMEYTNLPNHFVGFSAGFAPDTDEGGDYKPFYAAYSNGTAWARGEPVNTYALGWLDSSGKFHPYSYITGLMPYVYSEMQNTMVGNARGDKQASDSWTMPDPRAERFSTVFGSFGSSHKPSLSVYHAAAGGTSFGRSILSGRPLASEGFFSSQTSANGVATGDWMINSLSDTIHTDYYRDADGVVRPGDGVFGSRSSGDGMMLFRTNASPNGGSYATGDSAGNIRHGRRPVILNRPFRSVGELGYVFRDQPFKTLDFFSKMSADGALLEIFSLKETAWVEGGRLQSLAAGQINPNTAPFPVVQAVLAGGAKKEIDSSYNLTVAQAKGIAENLANLLNPASGPAPVLDRAELALALASDPATGSGPVRNAVTNSPDKGNKAYLEAPLRSLSEVGNLRTWNLLIDVVAQSGRMSGNAMTLNDFMVEGERRYWLHVAIDRYTGEVVSKELESVYE